MTSIIFHRAVDICEAQGKFVITVGRCTFGFVVVQVTRIVNSIDRTPYSNGCVSICEQVYSSRRALNTRISLIFDKYIESTWLWNGSPGNGRSQFDLSGLPVRSIEEDALQLIQVG